MKRARGDAGFALAALVCLLTAAAIVTAMMVPLRVMQTRRETEQELIFRGEEYVRAIQKYQRKYLTYPSSIDDLLSRDGFRFVRQKYKDPITGDDFRLINVNADGSLTGSLTLLSLPVSTQPTGVPGTMPGMPPSGSAAGGGNAPGGSSTGTSGRAGVSGQPTTSNLGGIANFGAGMGLGSNTGVSGMGNPLSGGGTTSGNNRAGVGGGGVGTGVGTGGGVLGGPVTPGTLGGGFGQIGNPLGGGGNTQSNTNSSTGTTGGGANPGGAPAAGAPSAIPATGFGSGGAALQITPGIAGVASESTQTSIMVYNEKDKYNEWEFIAPLVQTGANPAAGGGGQAPAGGGGGRGAGTTPGTNPFGGNPVGGGGNPVSPFGGGTNPTGGGGNFGRGPQGPGTAPGGGATPFGGGGAPRGAPPR